MQENVVPGCAVEGTSSWPIRDGTKVVGRLAPSPTGAQHLGNARTYLIAWLAARAARGRVILRIEDIDSPRVKPWAKEQAIVDLNWLGLDWDEGPDIEGPKGPYIQTQRAELYEQAIAKLLSMNLIYPCTCTRTDIADAASAPHAGAEGPIYPGTCAAWESGQPLPDGVDWSWRFRTSNRQIQIVDLVRGAVVANPARDLGDFPVTRKGGGAAYHLAVVVDDALMGINQVVRGDDLLPSAFRQLEIFEALGWGVPRFAHVPLVVGGDGRRLAKRHGDTRLSWYREHNVRPEEIVGWAAYTAGLIDRDEPLTATELLATWQDLFDWTCMKTDVVVVEGRFPVG